MPDTGALSPHALSITKDQLARLADLAALRIAPEEEDALRQDLKTIVRYVASLQDLDLSAVTPLTSVCTDLMAWRPDVPGSSPLRAAPQSASDQTPDAPTPGARTQDAEDRRARLLALAPETTAGFFRVPKVIE